MQSVIPVQSQICAMSLGLEGVVSSVLEPLP